MNRKPKLLLIHWIDAATGEDESPDDEFCECVLVGWLVKKTRWWIVVAPERGVGKYSKDRRGQFWKIPRRWIKEMKELDYETN